MTFKQELKSRWALLLAIILCATLVVHFTYEEITKPKAHETINVFVTAQSCDNLKLGKYIQDATNLKTTISSYAMDDKYYKESLQTSGLLLADLLILPQSILPEKSIDKEFAPLNNNELVEFGIVCENLEFYVKDNVNYAVKVYDKETKTNLLEKWAKFDGEENYYVLVNIARPNAAPYSTSKITTNNAFVALALILGF